MAWLDTGRQWPDCAIRRPAYPSALPDPRTDPGVEPEYKASWRTLAGTRRLSPATETIGPRSDEPYEGVRHPHRPFPYPDRVRHPDFHPSRRTPDFEHGRVDLRSLKD